MAASTPLCIAQPPARLARLDGLRGLAAVIVAFAYHSQFLFVPGAFAGYGPVVDWLHIWGWTLVDLFFVISGYIFAHVYLPGAKLAGKGGLADFAIARFARLYPLHLVMLMVSTLLFWHRPENSLLAFFVHLVMGQAFVSPVGHTFDGPSWSISIEAVCYVLFAAWAQCGERALAWFGAGAIYCAFVYFLLLGQLEGPWASDVLPRGLLGFFTGQFLWRKRDWLERVPAALLGILAIAGLCFDPARIAPILPLGLLTWPCVLLLALRLRVLESRPMLWLGDRSYSIYLVHMPLLDLAVMRFGPAGAEAGMVPGVHLAFIVAVLMLSELSYRMVELPARRAIRQRVRFGGTADRTMVAIPLRSD